MAGESSLLLGLSPELLGGILDYICDAADLLSLRPVCRAMEVFTERWVAERCFSTISILFSFPKSLWNALQIAKHPKFGKAVRSGSGQKCKSYPDNQSVREPYCINNLLPRSVYIQECTLSTQALAKPRFPWDFDLSKGGQELADHERNRQCYASLLEQQEMLFRDGQDFAYLENIFRSLETHGRRLRAVVEDVRELIIRATPARHFRVNIDESIAMSHRARVRGHEKDDARLIRHMYGLLPENSRCDAAEDLFARVRSTRRPLQAAMRAIAVTGVRVDAFAVDAMRFGISWSSLLESWSLHDLLPNFRGLTTSRLCFEQCTRTRDAGIRASEVDALVQYLQQLAPDLREFSLMSAGSREDNVYNESFEQIDEVINRRIFPDMTMPKLEKFVLEHFAVSFSTFVRFMVRHAGCLRKPAFTGHIWGCSFIENETIEKETLCKELEKAGFTAHDGLADCSLRQFSSSPWN